MLNPTKSNLQKAVTILTRKVSRNLCNFQKNLFGVNFSKTALLHELKTNHFETNFIGTNPQIHTKTCKYFDLKVPITQAKISAYLRSKWLLCQKKICVIVIF
jgi:hypothetical protein